MKNQGYQFNEQISVDGGHGRVETRRAVITSDIDWFEDKKSWKGLKSIGMIESTREMDGQISHEKRYYISSLDSDPNIFGNAVRRHWGIENSVHWILRSVKTKGMFRILCHGFGSRICLGTSGSKSQVREWAFNLPRRRSWLLLERSSWNHLFHL
ncbi:MAG: ISAs1 family transposase [Desulfobacter sp.]|nr:ISAs1 family transposase [Desulfobacter sp.]